MMYTQRRSVVRLVFTILCCALVVLETAPWKAAHGQEHFEIGEIADSRIVICVQLANAEALLAIIEEGGKAAGKRYVQDATHACSLGNYTFQVIDTVGMTKNDPSGVPWGIFRVRVRLPFRESVQGFSLAPSGTLVVKVNF